MKFKMFSILAASILLAATCVGCGTDISSSSSTTTTTTTKTSATSEVATDSTTTSVDSTTESSADTTESSSEDTSTEDTSVAHNADSTLADASNLTEEGKLAKVEEAAQAAFKSASEKGASTDEQVEAIAKATASCALDLGLTDTTVVAPIAGKTAGMNNLDGQACENKVAEYMQKGSVD